MKTFLTALCRFSFHMRTVSRCGSAKRKIQRQPRAAPCGRRPAKCLLPLNCPGLKGEKKQKVCVFVRAKLYNRLCRICSAFKLKLHFISFFTENSIIWQFHETETLYHFLHFYRYIWLRGRRLFTGGGKRRECAGWGRLQRNGLFMKAPEVCTRYR